MFSSVSIVFFLIDAIWGRCLSNGSMTAEELAKQWLHELDPSMVKVYGAYNAAEWNNEVNITDENAEIALDAFMELSHFENEACINASRFDWQKFTDPNLVRQFRNILGSCYQLTEDEIMRLFVLMGSMKKIYYGAEFCIKRPSTSATESQTETCVIGGPDLERILAITRDWKELLGLWEGWRNVSGRKTKSSFTEMVKLLNKDVKLQGYRDYSEFRQTVYEMENFSSACEKLWQQMKPLYQQLHAYVRRKLIQSYPNNTRDFPKTRHIPAHLTSHIWDYIFDLVKPFPNSSLVDLTELLRKKGFDAHRMFREADSFFTSLGLPPMPEEFWNHSLIEYPEDGREVDCGPQAVDFRNGRDFRIRQCTEITGELFATTHHEMGHVQYFISYKHLPFKFKDGANPGFHEAIGYLFALYAATPEHLHNINLLDNLPNNHESEINFLMQQALEKIIFLSFTYLIDKWRWGVFDGTITPDNYNRNYWKLRCELQGISPPAPRSEEDFDIGGYFPIGDSQPVISNFVSNIITFQFHKCLCDAAGHVGPLHKCDIYKSRKAGFKLRRMMSLGSSRHWQDAMEIMTRQRNMDAGPLLEYFRPLHDWLKNENQGREVGWDEECPSGSFQ